MRSQAGAISELASDLEGTTEILSKLKLLLADRNHSLDEEMAEIQVKPVSTVIMPVNSNG